MSSEQNDFKKSKLYKAPRMVKRMYETADDRNVDPVVKQLILLRKMRGYTQKTLAEALPIISKQRIATMESGKHSPSIYTIRVLAEFFDAGVSLTDWVK